MIVFLRDTSLFVSSLLSSSSTIRLDSLRFSTRIGFLALELGRLLEFKISSLVGFMAIVMIFRGFVSVSFRLDILDSSVSAFLTLGIGKVFLCVISSR